jgi:uncharacterized membrane protein
MVKFELVLHWISIVLGVYVVIFHVGAFVLESFLITSDIGVNLLGGVPDALATKLAVNQGVYNLVLALQMVVAIVLRHDAKLRLGVHLSVFVVGLAGAITVSATIALLQMLPGLLGAVATIIEIVFKRRELARA